LLSAVATGTPSPSVTLSWTKNWTLPAATNVLVQRATNSAFTAGVTNYPLVSASATSYPDTGVAANTQYYYRVRAENANSYSAWTNVAGAKTPAVSGTPLAPTNLAIGTATRNSIAVQWVNPPSSTVTTNVVQFSTAGPNGPWTSASPTAGPTATQYVITGLRNNTTYWIRVNAINAAGSAASVVRSGRTLR
jgi:phosphodiesterase/alkaline phosphatase D-like protein